MKLTIFEYSIILSALSLGSASLTARAFSEAPEVRASNSCRALEPGDFGETPEMQAYDQCQVQNDINGGTWTGCFNLTGMDWQCADLQSISVVYYEAVEMDQKVAMPLVTDAKRSYDFQYVPELPSNGCIDTPPPVQIRSGCADLNRLYDINPGAGVAPPKVLYENAPWSGQLNVTGFVQPVTLNCADVQMGVFPASVPVSIPESHDCKCFHSPLC